MKSYKLIGKIVKVEGECVAGHHVGEEFDLTLYSEKADKFLAGCPDNYKVLVEIRRIRA